MRSLPEKAWPWVSRPQCDGEVRGGGRFPWERAPVLRICEGSQRGWGTCFARIRANDEAFWILQEWKFHTHLKMCRFLKVKDISYVTMVSEVGKVNIAKIL